MHLFFWKLRSESVMILCSSFSDGGKLVERSRRIFRAKGFLVQKEIGVPEAGSCPPPFDCNSKFQVSFSWSASYSLLPRRNFSNKACGLYSPLMARASLEAIALIMWFQDLCYTFWSGSLEKTISRFFVLSGAS